MTQQVINTGAAPNDGAGDPLRTAFTKTNNNFTELYAGTGAAGIANGTSNVVIQSNSSVYLSVAGTANVAVVSSTAITANAAILSSNSTGGVGYSTGAGGAVTQLTNKGTGVTLNAICGEITANAATLNAATTVSFLMTNSAIAATDVLTLNHVSGGTLGSYALNAAAGSGNATIYLRNISASSLSEAVVIRFATVKAVTS